MCVRRHARTSVRANSTSNVESDCEHKRSGRKSALEDPTHSEMVADSLELLARKARKCHGQEHDFEHTCKDQLSRQNFGGE